MATMSQVQMDGLAEKAQALFRISERSLWSAGVVAEKAKTAFEATQKIGRWSWGAFCESLERDTDTVSNYVRAVRYCNSKKIKIESSLPPIACVGWLAGSPLQAQPELHRALFEDRVSASKFQELLREAKKAESVNEEVLESEKASKPLPSSQYSAKIQASETVVTDTGVPSLIRIFSAIQPDRETLNAKLRALKVGEKYSITVERIK